MTTSVFSAALSTLFVPKAITDAEAELFSPMARRPYDLERRFTAHALPLGAASRSVLDVRRDAEYDSRGVTPFEAMSPLAAGPPLDATTAMTIPAVTITPAPASLLISGPCMKRNRWNAWQPRGALGERDRGGLARARRMVDDAAREPRSSRRHVCRLTRGQETRAELLAGTARLCC